ncbi:MAG: DsrE family protein [Burkholderiales bacterium]|nr:DsrE family protein [Burkholderiales bacterium]
MKNSAAGTLLVIAALAGGCAATGGDRNIAEDRVVYRVNDSNVQAANALRNISNHLEVNPKAKIVVVTHAQGVDFLMDGAKDAKDNPYNIAVEQLKGQGVQFDVCQITLRNGKL